MAIEEVAVRNYVCGEVGAHLIGQVGPIFADEYESLSEQGYAMNDQIGRSGIEGAFEEYLRGQDGEQIITFDNSGNVISTEETKAPEPEERWCFPWTWTFSVYSGRAAAAD